MAEPSPLQPDPFAAWVAEGGESGLVQPPQPTNYLKEAIGAGGGAQHGVLAAAGIDRGLNRQVSHRAYMLPYAEYDDGSAGVSYPKIVPDTWASMEKAGRALQMALGLPGTENFTREDVMPTVQDANLLSGLAMTGPGFLARPRVSAVSGKAPAQVEALSPLPSHAVETGSSPVQRYGRGEGTQAATGEGGGLKPVFGIEPLGATDDAFWITKNGQRIGTAAVDVKGTTARIGSIKTNEPLGVAGLRGLREAFRKIHPKVVRFESYHDERISGARNGPAATAETPKTQSVKFTANAPESAPVGLLPAAAAGESKGIRAFHGSPHDFDRFDASKIGTGEGAQAYGHGLYFAEAEGTARTYRDKLQAEKNIQIGQRALENPGLGGGATRQAYYTLVHESGDIDRAIQRASAAMNAEEVQGVLRQWKAEGVSTRPGRLYEVRLNAEPEQFLDWDKPLSQQPQSVRQAFETELAKNPLGALWLKRGDAYEVSTGSLINAVAHDPGFAQGMGDAGVPGIRYLDQGSRGKGEGTYNYVVFPGNEHLIDIVKKYGIAGAAALLGMSQTDLAEAMQSHEGSEPQQPLYTPPSRYEGTQDRMHQLQNEMRKMRGLPPVGPFSVPPPEQGNDIVWNYLQQAIQ